MNSALASRVSGERPEETGRPAYREFRDPACFNGDSAWEMLLQPWSNVKVRAWPADFLDSEYTCSFRGGRVLNYSQPIRIALFARAVELRA